MRIQSKEEVGPMAERWQQDQTMIGLNGQKEGAERREGTWSAIWDAWNWDFGGGSFINNVHGISWLKWHVVHVQWRRGR